jgi:Taurine catabolism dioxygenase TauD, TfdA family
VSDYLQDLERRRFAWVRDGLDDVDGAFEVARALIDARSAVDRATPLAVVGDFVLPPVDGPDNRDFQTLHFDFGVPLDPKLKRDVGRYTALYIPKRDARVSAVTRLVPLRALLGQRAWPPAPKLLERLVAYGKTHGAWDDDHGYLEGSLARVVEAAAGVFGLPSVKVEAGFLCGTEFDSLGAELQFFARHALRVADVQIEVPLSPGELLVFDNLAVAHGRRGIRRPGELRQRVFGESRVGIARQRELRDGLLAAFGGSPTADREPVSASGSSP